MPPSGRQVIDHANRPHTGYSGQESWESDVEFFTRMRASQQKHLARSFRRGRRRRPLFIRYPGGGRGHPIQSRRKHVTKPPEPVPFQRLAVPGIESYMKEPLASRTRAQMEYLARFKGGHIQAGHRAASFLAPTASAWRA